MLRPPETGGHGQSDFNELDDAEITPKRGQPEGLPDDTPTGQDTLIPGDRPTLGDQPGDLPAEGQPDMRLPGADQDSSLPGGQGDDLPQKLGERIENGSSSSMAIGGPDVLPDVEPPETTM